MPQSPDGKFHSGEVSRRQRILISPKSDGFVGEISVEIKEKEEEETRKSIASSNLLQMTQINGNGFLNKGWSRLLQHFILL